MSRLGEDLFLLSVNPRRGTVRGPAWLGCSLAGAEMAEAQSLGLIYYDGEHVRSRAVPTGAGHGLTDLLNEIARAVEQARRPVRPSDLVVKRHRPAIEAASRRLIAAGVVSRRPASRLGAAAYRYEITEPGRAAAALERLRRASAAPPATMVMTEQAQEATLLGGLAHLALLARPHLRGAQARPARERLRRSAERHWICVAVAQGISDLMYG